MRRIPINRTHCKNGHPWIDENIRYYRGFASCKKCSRESVNRYYSRLRQDPERYKNYYDTHTGHPRHKTHKLRWEENNKEWDNFRKTLKRYDLTLDQYHAISERQDFHCALCDSEYLYVDHNHKTSKVRGLLCSKHNLGIGHFDDDPTLLRKTADYVEAHR